MTDNYERALQSLWKGKMTVIIRTQTKNETTKQNEFSETVLFENEPCRLSFSSITPTENSVGAAETAQSVKVFCSQTLDIPAGSKLVIEQNGRVSEYSKSGEPAVYTYHQEIPLKLFERWA